MCWGSLRPLTEWVVSVLLTVTQPIPGVVWAHLADFLLLQECRTLLMQIDLLSYHQTFMILVCFVVFFFLISDIKLTGSTARSSMVCSAREEMEEDLQVLLDSTLCG